MINILLSQFYDGCAVFRNKVSSFHPLVITILNLPPNYRFKLGNFFFSFAILCLFYRFVLGVGMFALAIFSSDIKSVAEDFLFNNLFHQI